MGSLLAALVFASLVVNPPHYQAVTVHGPKAILRLEVADTPKKRELGLMYRRALLEHTGMVFVFEADSLVGFWMKNTLVPLDMVFLGPDGRVRAVFANVPRSTLRTPEAKVARRDGEGKFVLELPAGEAAQDGLVPGARLPELQRLKARPAK
ncbi:MAG: DUF192 domain-containing protein [Candidatus Baltobacteraceae bacterium]